MLKLKSAKEKIWINFTAKNIKKLRKGQKKTVFYSMVKKLKKVENNKKKTITKKQVMKALEEVIDPEIGISLVEMNLIKDVLIEGDKVKIKMTLTIPGCPLASYLVNEVKKKVESLAGVSQAQVELVWD